jgi:hypothetical protein
MRFRIHGNLPMALSCLLATAAFSIHADGPEARNQNEDGSWQMTSRAHPGAKPMTNVVPITYFGSAWATLGLLRSVPRGPELDR